MEQSVPHFTAFFDATSDNVYYMKLNDYFQYTNLLFA